MAASDAKMSHDVTAAVSAAVPDEEMEDETLGSDAGTLPRMRSVASITSGSAFSVSDASRNIPRRSPESLQHVAELLRELIHEGLSEKPKRDAAFAMRKEHVSNGRYDERPDHRIPIIALAHGLRSDLGIDATERQRDWWCGCRTDIFPPRFGPILPLKDFGVFPKC
jgi:hypothetical protein